MQNGDFGLTVIGGPVGILVALGQLINGDASRYTHAFVVVNADKGILFEARPGGAGYAHISKYAGKPIAFSHIEISDEQRQKIVECAVRLKGRGYGWEDYVSLALVRLGIRPKWLVRYVTNKGHLICSQLVDEAYNEGGYHLFNDGRLSLDVTPGDLTYIGNVY